MKKIRTLAWWWLGGSLLLAGVLLAGTFSPITTLPTMRIVLSGSMVPHLPVGSVVFVLPEATYAVGDVITFYKADSQIPTSHRVVSTVREGGSVHYLTKGDANEEADTGSVAYRDVVGKVVATVPRLGYVFAFARSEKGFLTMVVIPAGLIILDELLTIVGALRGRRKEAHGVSCARKQDITLEPRLDASAVQSRCGESATAPCEVDGVRRVVKLMRRVPARSFGIDGVVLRPA